ncbi:GNAT family N-acetyltransferase [Arcanobacterium ihumii]|uniref:GNAT family N-acetyltransferase n=1 Tax=Arcanobacterium ihumii TaxID=2138162 RepID=UPI001F1C2444|nr:DUF4081 domain-containing GNAT family N-acetyltransferase [Arcanobacterium ihumii]
MRFIRGSKQARIGRLPRHLVRPAAYLLERDVVGSVFLRAALVDKQSFRGSHFLALFDDDGEIRALCFHGANLAPWGFDDDGLELLGDYLGHETIFASSLVGPADQVMGLWSRINWRFPHPRDIRPHQLSMVFEPYRNSRFAADIKPGRSTLVGAPHKTEMNLHGDGEERLGAVVGVRRGTLNDFDIVFPASVAMFVEEVGYDPTIYGDGYAKRVRQLLAEGRTFIQTGKDPYGVERVEFKADIGVLVNGHAQIQGVWTAPDLRGQGIASGLIYDVSKFIVKNIAPTVSLYVNDFNHAAVRVYDKAGFVQVGEFATVLL